MPDLAADVALLADADRREPLQHYGKDQQRVDGDDEVGNRDEADRQHRDQLVREAIAANGGEAAERDADEGGPARSEEHTSELQSLMRISYAVFCLKKKKTTKQNKTTKKNKQMKKQKNETHNRITINSTLYEAKQLKLHT